MLDDLMPDHDFSERHHRRIHASVDEVWDALCTLTLADLTVTRPLTALRHPGAPADRRPLLTHGPLQLLELDAGHHALAGAVAQPWRPHAPRHEVETVEDLLAFDRPGWTKYLTSFRVDPVGADCVVSTETRGVSTDAGARRRFALYWALIRVPSGVIRRDVLRSVARRVEPARIRPAAGLVRKPVRM